MNEVFEGYEAMLRSSAGQIDVSICYHVLCHIEEAARSERCRRTGLL